jgi:hypothetical protein
MLVRQFAANAATRVRAASITRRITPSDAIP